MTRAGRSSRAGGEASALHFVPPLVPAAGIVHTLILGDAPATTGAWRSGVPFLGEAIGTDIFGGLLDIGVCRLGLDASALAWSGAEWRDAGVRPTLDGVAIACVHDANLPMVAAPPGRRGFRRRPEGEPEARRFRSLIARLRLRGLRQILPIGESTATFAAAVVGGDPVLIRPFASVELPGPGEGLAAVRAAWRAQLCAAVREYQPVPPTLNDGLPRRPHGAGGQQ